MDSVFAALPSARRRKRVPEGPKVSLHSNVGTGPISREHRGLNALTTFNPRCSILATFNVVGAINPRCSREIGPAPTLEWRDTFGPSGTRFRLRALGSAAKTLSTEDPGVYTTFDFRIGH